MQATMTTKRPGVDRVTGVLVALGVVAGIAVGAVGQAIVDDSESTTSRVAAEIQLDAYTGAEQGEARLSDSRMTIPQLKAYTSVNQGEGLLNPDMRIAGPITPTIPLDTMRYLEQNLYLPSATTDEATRRMIYDRLLEENLDIAPVIVPDAQLWRLLEQNSWGEDFTFDAPAAAPVYPSSDDVPQRQHGVVTY